MIEESLNKIGDIHIEEDNIVVEFKTYGLEEAKTLLQFLRPKSGGGEGGGHLFF